MTTPQDPADPRDRAELHATDASPLTEAEERAVTAVLLDAVGQGPVATPPEVVSRLDDVLAGLVAERAGSVAAAAPATAASGATVVQLDEQHRPRRWPRLLLAAAAVVVGGYAVSHLPSTGSDSASSADSAGGSSESGADVPDSASKRQAHTGGGLAGTDQMTLAPEVRSDHLAADVRRVVRMFPPRPLVEQPQDPTPSDSASGPVEDTTSCPVPRLFEGQRLYEVTFHGAPSGLVVSPPRKGAVEVTVYGCRDGGTQLTRTVPAP